MPALPPNPYIVGPPVSGEAGFFGRQDILSAVEETLRAAPRNSVILYGQRRIGKTSLLLQLERQLPSPPFFPIYIELADKALLPTSQVLHHLAVMAAAKAGLAAPLAEPFSRNPATFHEDFLPALYGALGGERRPVFLLDEFEPVNLPLADLPEEAAVRGLSGYLHSLLLSQTEADFVFTAGRRMDELSSVPEANFQADLVRLIPVLAPAEARALILQNGGEGAPAYDEVALSRILALTRGHPELTQWVCYHLFERAAGRAEPDFRVTLEDVEAVILELGQADNPSLRLIWQSLPPAERIVLAAMGRRSLTDDLITQADLDETLAETRLAPENPRLRQAAANLVRWQLLERLGEEYTFFIEDTGRWVSRERPLEQVVKSELARLSSQASALYQAARQAHQAGQPQAAIDKLQQVLALQADHLPARVLLARIFQEEGRLAEAVAEYEKAYQQDRAIGPGLLAPALVAYGISLEEAGREVEAPAVYERALSLNPADPAAQARLAALKQRQATPPHPIPEPRPAEAQPQPASRRIWGLAAAGLLLALLLFLVCGQGYNPFNRTSVAPASPAAAITLTATPAAASPTPPATVASLVAVASPSPTATSPALPSPTPTEALPSPTPVATATELAAAMIPPTPVPTQVLEGQIRFAGSTSMGRLVRDLAGAFDFAIPEANVGIEVRDGGSQTGLEALRQGEAEVALVSRAVTEAELGDNFRVFPLAQQELIAVVVHPLVMVDSLTLEQVRAIFAGEITTWAEVGGNEAPIMVVTRREGSGTRTAFEQIVMGEGGASAQATISVPSNEAMRDMVAARAYAIGYMALEYTQSTPPFAPGQVDWAVLDTALLEVKPLALDEVQPNAENGSNGTYPLVRPFNLVTQATPDPLVQVWLDFIFSAEGEEVIERTGHLPAAP